MSDPVPIHHHDGLPTALFLAWAAQRYTLEDLPDGLKTTAAWDELDERSRVFWRGVAARLQGAGVLTLLEAPEGYDVAEAAVEPAVVGAEVIRLTNAVRVLAISLGFLRGDGGELVLAGAFTGYPRSDPDTQVAAPWVMGRAALLGFLKQIVDNAGATAPMLAVEIGSTVNNAVQAVLDSMDKVPGTVVVPARPLNRQERRHGGDGR